MNNFVTLPGNPGYCELTYDELKKLRDDAQLISGLQYRITDYECTTMRRDGPADYYVLDTSLMSAGHAFDIIVTADSSSTLNAKAKAAHHAGDTYFRDSDLDSWELIYDLDNDIDKYAWAYNMATSITDSSGNVMTRPADDNVPILNFDKNDNNKANGYIYRYGNRTTSGTSTTFYGCTTPCPKAGDTIYKFTCPTNQYPTSINGYTSGVSRTVYGTVASSVIVEGKGVISWMKDEFGNEAPYDFKNIKFERTFTVNDWDPETGNEIQYDRSDYYYTFTYFNSLPGGDISIEDYSVKDSSRMTTWSELWGVRYDHCENNVIEPLHMGYNAAEFYHATNQLRRFNACLIWACGTYNGYNVNNNHIGIDGFKVTIHGSNCEIGKECNSIMLDDRAPGNYSGDGASGVSNIHMLSGCSDITLGHNISSITFLPGCQRMSFLTDGVSYARISDCVVFPSGYDTYNVLAANNVMYENGYFYKGNFHPFDGTVLSVQYNYLKELYKKGSLIPGMQYRITDYECTVGDIPNVSTASNSFDIIVTADSSYSFNENAKAIPHEYDYYFQNSNLAAWELKYSIDNDSKYAWTRPYSGSIIAALGAEDNRQMNFVRVTDSNSLEFFDGQSTYLYTNSQLYGNDVLYTNEALTTMYDPNWEYGYISDITNFVPEGKGVIYYMKDEFGNECGYDFKNIKFAFVDSSSALIDSSTHYYYTFTDASTDGDLSMKKDSSTICEKNYIMAIDDSSVFVLPHTVFIASNSVFNNTIKRASNNVFGVAYNNDMGTIGDCVFDNVFDLNTVETAFNTWFKGVAEANHIKYISNSEFGNNFAFNTIRYMSTTKAGDGFMLNDVGDYFLNSSFGNNCVSNFFGPYSGTITAGNDFMQNTMQNQCHHLTFGNTCKFNNLGSVGYIRMGNNCTDNFIGNGKYIYFGNSSNQGADWICGNKFEGITQYVYFYNTSSASSSNMLRKYHMYNICGTSDTWKSISETTRNNSKETFVLTRPGYVTPAANSLIYVDPAMLPERTKGGTAGQILVKVSGTDYDMGWRTVSIGSQIAYDSSNKVISLKDASGNVLGTPVDATDFIKDGMVSDVSVYDGNLVITFNTDAGEDPISIPLTSFFDPDLYYTKTQVDASFAKDASLLWTKGNGSNSIRTIADNTDASITGSHAVALGQRATIQGNYGCVAEGSNCVIIANTAHAEGYGCTINSAASYSHAEGYHTTINSYAMSSHVEGYYTIVNNHSEHASGHYNNSHHTSSGTNVNNTVDGSLNTTFSIGIGTDNNDRKNALEIMQNADTYIVGIGTYDGSNYQNASTLQEVITNLESASGTADLMTNVTYSELKALRDSSSLAPGMQYRITDYHTRVSKTGIESADHRFDVIVVADTSASLNESARVCHSADDTANYYGGSELEAYEIRYCLDNDLSKFGWADSTTGTGVIWYMKDEYRNEAFYDFTNITFSNKYTFNNSGSDARLASGALIHDNVIKHHYDGYMNTQISDASFYTLTPNNIVFDGTFVYNNTFGPDCYDLKFGNQTVGNSFEGAVWDCSFGNTTLYNRFGTYITSCNFPAKLATSEIGSNCWYLNVTSSLTTVRCNILGSVKGTSASSKLAVAITEANQFIGLNSSGVLKKWIPADLIN